MQPYTLEDTHELKYLDDHIETMGDEIAEWELSNICALYFYPQLVEPNDLTLLQHRLKSFEELRAEALNLIPKKEDHLFFSEKLIFQHHKCSRLLSLLKTKGDRYTSSEENFITGMLDPALELIKQKKWGKAKSYLKYFLFDVQKNICFLEEKKENIMVSSSRFQEILFLIDIMIKIKSNISNTLVHLLKAGEVYFITRNFFSKRLENLTKFYAVLSLKNINNYQRDIEGIKSDIIQMIESTSGFSQELYYFLREQEDSTNELLAETRQKIKEMHDDEAREKSLLREESSISSETNSPHKKVSFSSNKVKLFTGCELPAKTAEAIRQLYRDDSEDGRQVTTDTEKRHSPNTTTATTPNFISAMVITPISFIKPILKKDKVEKHQASNTLKS